MKLLMSGRFEAALTAAELLARPSIELVTVDSVMVKKAEQQIESCEHCHPDVAEIPLDWLLAGGPLRVHLERTGALSELQTRYH